MQISRQVLSVFLASPGDVTTERRIAEEVVTEINRSVGRQLGWVIDLSIWENTTPGYGRPQAIINAMVDSCSVFIGLLWERWGQPTGVYSSGFEEEFERARARRETSREPDIWLVFKHVDPDKLKDPGPQLSKVLEFRKTQVELREVLFHDVRDTDDWKAKLHSWLLAYVLELALPIRSSQPQLSGPVSVLESTADSATLDLVSNEQVSVAIPQALQTSSKLFSTVVQSGNLEFYSSGDNILGEFEVARLSLLTASWMSQRYTAELFGIHFVNLLYKYKEKLEPTPPEEYQLLRNVVAHTGTVVPGWFWFSESSPDSVEQSLVILSKDSLADVRAHALQLLSEAQIRLPDEVLPALPFDDDSPAVRERAYEYLVSLGDNAGPTVLEILLKEDLPDPAAVRRARLKLLTVLDPSKALSDIVGKDEYVTDDELEILKGNISAIDDESLLNALDTSWEQVRKFVIQELVLRNRLPDQVANKLTTDESLEIRALALESLAKKGMLGDLDEVRAKLSTEAKSGGLNLALLGALGGALFH